MVQFLKWLCSWVRMVDGFIGIITYGYVFSNMSLSMAKILSRYRSKHDV